MGEVGAIRITQVMLALRERSDSTASQQGVVPALLLQATIIDLLQILDMHRLREAGVLANQFDSVAVGLVLIAGLFSFRQRCEPLIVLVAFGILGPPTQDLLVLCPIVALVEDSQPRFSA